ncbi:hypothetical protein EAH79_11870 [Sphingomonas koreensis]|nr:hypothetical protein EAH79_11870 [Sphingomonas koreensis]
MHPSLRRTIVSGVAAGVLIYAIGFLTFGTPLYWLSASAASPKRVAALQDAIALNLGPTGTGAYDIPNPKQPETAARLARGPVATVFFEQSGLSRPAANSVIGGIIICILTGTGLASALRLMANLPSASRLGAAAALIVTFTLYRDLGQPIFNAYGWRYFAILFVQDTLALVGGAALALFVQVKDGRGA